MGEGDPVSFEVRFGIAVADGRKNENIKNSSYVDAEKCRESREKRGKCKERLWEITDSNLIENGMASDRSYDSNSSGPRKFESDARETKKGK